MDTIIGVDIAVLAVIEDGEVLLSEFPSAMVDVREVVCRVNDTLDVIMLGGSKIVDADID